MKKIALIVTVFAVVFPLHGTAERPAGESDMQRLDYLIETNDHRRISKIFSWRSFNKEQLYRLYQHAQECETQRGKECGRIHAMHDNPPVGHTYSSVMTSGTSVVAGVGTIGLAGVCAFLDQVLSPLTGFAASIFPPIALLTIGVAAIASGSLEFLYMLWPSPSKKQLATEAYENAQLVTRSIVEKLATL